MDWLVGALFFCGNIKNEPAKLIQKGQTAIEA